MERSINDDHGPTDQPKAAPRTGSRRGAERRERILAAAREHFLARGYGATSIDEIVATAGGSKATVYAAFGGKDGLFHALIGEITTSIRNQSTNHFIDDQLPPREGLTQIGTAAIALILSPHLVDLFRLAVGEAARFPELGRAFWRSGPVSTGAAVADYLSKQAQCGALRIEDANEASDVFFSILVDRRVTALALGATEFPSPAEAQRHVQRAVELFMRMFGPREF
jgi:TetR/AcrR family transcriptional regulator, mexJK operon transcriptional repressor